MICYFWKRLTIFLISCVLLIPLYSNAAPVTFEFTATVTEVHPNLTSMTGLLGQVGTGKVSYEGVPVSISYGVIDKTYGYESPPASFEFSIAGHTYIAGTEAHIPVGAFDADVQVELGIDRMTWPNVPLSDRIRYWGLWTGQTIDDHEFKMELILNDQTRKVLNSTVLPSRCPNLADFDPYPNTQFVIMVNLSPTVSTSGITCRVDAITPISHNVPFQMALTLPESATEGDGVLTAQGRIDFNPAPTEDITVTLDSSDESILTVPQSISISSQSTSVTFDLTINDEDDVPNGAHSVNVTASNDIFGTTTQSISILDNDQVDEDEEEENEGNGDGDDNNRDGDDDSKAFDLTGTWAVTEIADERDCGEGINTKQYTVTLTQNGASLRAQTPYGTFNGSVNGQVATWQGKGSEDGGELDTHIRATITINADGNNFTGNETWTWSNGVFQCSGTSELSGSLSSTDIGSKSSTSGGGGGGGGCFISATH